MKFHRLAFEASLALAGLILIASRPAFAQAEIGAYGGGAHQTGGTHAVAGGSVGVHVSQVFQLFGDVNYIPLGSQKFSVPGVGSSSFSAKMLNLGGGVMAGIPTSGGKVTPYVLVIGGVGHQSVSYSSSGPISTSGSASAGNFGYFGGGSGIRLMAGQSWGFRPEFRYQHYLQGGGNLLLFTGGIFFQFGK